jgi:hypothetical protein
VQILAAPFLSLGIPLDPHKVPFLKSAPKGLRLLHAASSVPEAEMLTQVLIAEGFQIEFVPSITTGVFGTTGNSEIYVAEADYDRAVQFLKEYLTPPEPESE